MKKVYINHKKLLAVVIAVMLLVSLAFLPAASASAATSYTLTFNLNGGSRTGGGETTQTVSHGQIYASITVPTVTKTGYTFDGWWLDAACTTTSLGSVSANGITSNVTVYAKWTPNSLTVTYSPNGGSISSGSSTGTVTAGIYYSALSTPTVTRTGYTFSGWYTSGGIAISSIPQQSITSDITLYAYWTLDSSGTTTYTVTYNANGGSISSGSSTQTVTSGTIYSSLSTPTVTRSGYTFAGWWLDAACTTTTLGSVSANGITSNVTLYAKWTVSGGGTTTYTVTYDPNGGSITSGSSTQTVTSGTQYASLTTPLATRANYTLRGWYTSSGDLIDVLPEYTVTSDITFYAQWTYNPTGGTTTYTVTYNTNGGIISSGNGSQSVATGTKYSALSYPTVIKTDYKFAGWYIDAACTTNPVSEIQSSTITSAVILYAKWTQQNLIVTYNPNGGDVVSGNATQSAAYGQLYVSLTPPTVSRTNYNFAGWWLDAACTTTPLGSLSANGIASDITVYAKWTPNLLYVTYNANGGDFTSEGSNVQEITYGTHYAALSLPGVSRQGYTFAGWYDEDGNAIYATPQKEITYNITLVVKWAELKYMNIGNNIDTQVQNLTFTYNIETGKYETKILLNDCGKTYIKIFNKIYTDNVNKNINTTASLFNMYYDECNTTPFAMFPSISQRIGSIETNMELRYAVVDNGVSIKYTGIILAVTADKIQDSYAKIIYAQSGSVEEPDDSDNWFTDNKGAIIAVMVIIAVISIVLLILTRFPLFLWIGIIAVALTFLMAIIF